MQKPPAPQVLFVDQSEDAREVVEFAMDRKGVTLATASNSADGMRSAKSIRPELIVLDVETLGDGQTGQEDFVMAARVSNSKLLLIGEDPPRKSTQTDTEHLQKPYHYSALVNKIESILACQQISQLESVGEVRTTWTASTRRAA